MAEALAELGFWPRDPVELARVLETDPYEIRARGLTQRLDPFELGRALLHLSQRRGFLSTRKAGKQADDGVVKAAIGELDRELNAAGSVSYGQFFHQVRTHAAEQGGTRAVRRRWISRQMVEHEFGLLWSAQAAFYPQLTDTLRWGKVGRRTSPARPEPLERGERLLDRYGLQGIAFFQRATYWSKETIGACELEASVGRSAPRVPVWHREFQRFQLLQDVSNLRFVSDRVDQNGEISHQLTPAERERVLDHMATRAEVKLSSIRKFLGAADNFFTVEDDDPNKKLLGPRTDLKLGGLAVSYTELDERSKSAVCAIVLDDALDVEEAARQIAGHGVPEDEAHRLALEGPAKLGQGRGRYSLAAIRRLTPGLEQGLPLQARAGSERSAMTEAGYPLSWERSSGAVDRLGPAPDVPNPIARQALSELRKVVNALIAEHGKPDLIRVELARELKQSADRRREVSSRMKWREKMRDTAAKEIESCGERPTRKLILKWLLREEQGGLCLACSSPLGTHALLNGSADVDHILPRWQSLDDSQNNKALLCSRCNASKGQRTFAQWLGADGAEFQALVARAEELRKSHGFPAPKLRRIRRTDPVELEDFVQRQLSDTRYISREAARYLSSLYDKPQAIQVMSGGVTADLRREWGLNDILSEGDAKTRDDHRHHAVDAAVIGLTSAREIKRVADHHSRGAAGTNGSPVPFQGVRDVLATAVAEIVVSHKRLTRPVGALHEETIYGPTSKPPIDSEPLALDERPWARGWVEDPGKVAVRKMLVDVSEKDLESVRDQTLRRELLEYASVGWTKERREAFRRPSGQTVRSVRLLVPAGVRQPRSKALPKQLVKLGNNHRVTYWRDETKGRIRAQVDSTKAMVEGSFEEPPGPKLFSLRAGDMFEIDGDPGRFVVVKMRADNGRLEYKPHVDARDGSDRALLGISPSHARLIRPIRVDVLGRITPGPLYPAQDDEPRPT